MSNVLKIEFDNEKALNHFASWLCESGEQSYWQWMECREEEEDGNITATRFWYHRLANQTIETVCGRLDE